MRISSSHDSIRQERSGAVLWVLVAAYAVGVVMPIFPQLFPMPLLAAAEAVPALLFALLHGAGVYRLRGMIVFVSISLAVGYIAEALGVHTGFPFGHYYFTDGMGPKLFQVPILMGPAYVGMGYVSWTVARVITASGNPRHGLGGLRLITLPLAAGFVMVAWDIAIDPVLSTFAHYWIWTRGGAFFGVPASNFLGWYGTNYLIYQFFALYLRGRSSSIVPVSGRQDRLATIFYAVCAAGIVVRAVSAPASSTLLDPAGVSWRVGDINAASALAAFFIMGAFVTLALVRFSDAESPGPRPVYSHGGDLDEAEITFLRQDEFEQMQ
jgi:uncharacterized membrane protein